MDTGTFRPSIVLLDPAIPEHLIILGHFYEMVQSFSELLGTFSRCLNKPNTNSDIRRGEVQKIIVGSRARLYLHQNILRYCEILSKNIFYRIQDFRF